MLSGGPDGWREAAGGSSELRPRRAATAAAAAGDGSGDGRGESGSEAELRLGSRPPKSGSEAADVGEALDADDAAAGGAAAASAAGVGAGGGDVVGSSGGAGGRVEGQGGGGRRAQLAQSVWTRLQGSQGRGRGSRLHGGARGARPRHARAGRVARLKWRDRTCGVDALERGGRRESDEGRATWAGRQGIADGRVEDPVRVDVGSPTTRDPATPTWGVGQTTREPTSASARTVDPDMRRPDRRRRAGARG